MLIRKIISTAICIGWTLVLLEVALIPANAQVDEIVWSPILNLSNTPDKVSTDPFLLADPAGTVHLFWAEVVKNVEGGSADTMLYSSWNGTSWSKPLDLFFSPLSDGTPALTYPRGAIDENGNIHLIWLSLPNDPNYALNYSSVYAPEAGLTTEWKSPVRLAEDLSGARYSADIAYNPNQGLHVMYARVPLGEKAEENRTVSYMYSMDRGTTWSEPVDIYTTQYTDRGASDIKILLEPPNNIYASWTEWDESGNGQVVYFIRSQDNGKTWDEPVPLDVRRENEYERDMNNMALIGPNQIVSIWEGGYRAYRHEQYSYDGGATWTDPVEIFPWLIGDNGSVEFATDSAGVLHTFIASRIREGNEERGDLIGLWHSKWEGGQRWREPTFVGGKPTITNPKIALINGNQVVAVWTTSKEAEIYVTTGVISNAPYQAPIPWPKPVEVVTSTQSSLQPNSVLVTPTVTPTPAPLPINTQLNRSPGLTAFMWFGLIPSIVVIVLAIFVVNRRQSRKL